MCRGVQKGVNDTPPLFSAGLAHSSNHSGKWHKKTVVYCLWYKPQGTHSTDRQTYAASETKTRTDVSRAARSPLPCLPLHEPLDWHAADCRRTKAAGVAIYFSFFVRLSKWPYMAILAAFLSPIHTHQEDQSRTCGERKKKEKKKTSGGNTKLGGTSKGEFTVRICWPRE